ncbi:MAG: RNA polymerase sigma factor [Planctomycetota bacterium]
MQPPGEKPVDEGVTALSATNVPAFNGLADGPADGVDVADCDDGALARRIAMGDRAAAGELVRRYHAMVRGFLRKICFDRDAAEDLSQETFVRALKYAHRFDPKYPMRTWLLTIARRLSINHGQKAKRRRGVPGVEAIGLEDTRAPAPPLESERAERAALSSTLLDAALKRLSEPQRLAIVMHYQQSMPLEEIGKALDMPVGTVKSHLYRGRKRMRELLEPREKDVMP